MFRKILVGYDGSKGGRAALQRAAVIARESKAEITVLWVREPLPRHSDLPGEYEEEAEAANEYFKDRQKEVQEVAAQHGVAIRCETRRGHPAKTILRFADEGGHDLIVTGHSDHSELWGRLLGDTADRISDHAHCSVLIVKS
ncbi:MAG: universal stress protein [Verrucomicrobiota bacterium]|jgi:nucleotide-binding universal stress UspA family protein